MSILKLIENSALIEWFLVSMWGFPVFIALHSVGMAFVVGISLIVAIRCSGSFDGISIGVVNKLISIAWLGFALNLLTGLFLILSRISEYLFDVTFLLKMSFVIGGAIGLRLLQLNLIDRGQAPNRYIPIFTIVCWFAAVTAGRWIAYLSGMYG